MRYLRSSAEARDFAAAATCDGWHGNQYSRGRPRPPNEDLPLGGKRGGVARSGAPSRTGPEEGGSKPAAHCSRVDLPDPDAPMTAVNEPREKAYVTSRSAATLLAPER